MKRILSIVLALLLLISAASALGSCKKSDDSSSDPYKTTLTDIELIKGGETEYKLVYAQDTPAAVEASIALKKKFKDVANIKLESIPQDEADFTELTTEGSKLILLGNTTFDETKQAKAKMKRANCDEFIIENIDDDIVIVTLYNSYLDDAVNYFVNTLFDRNYNAETSTLMFEAVTFLGTTPMPTGFDMAQLEKYTIIYDEDLPGMLLAANRLRDYIESKTDHRLEVLADEEAIDSPYEILFGETNRELSAITYADSSLTMKYMYNINNGILQFAAGGAYTSNKCIDKFIELYGISSTSGNTLIPSGTHFETNLANIVIDLTEGSDVRVMSANLLGSGSATGPVLSVEQRAEIFCGVLLTYKPDLIGVQEADIPWQISLDAYLKRIEKLDGISYKHILKTCEGAEAWDSIIYRADEYKLDYSKSDAKPYTPDGATRHSSAITSAKFTSISDPSVEIAIVNAHWHWEKENASDVPNQHYDALDVAKTVRDLQAMFPTATVFTTGDFNSHRFKGEYFNQFVNEVNGRICSDVAKTNGVLTEAGGCRTAHTNMVEGFIRPVDDNFIDHIVGTGNFDVKRHTSILENCTNLLSDHSLIFADIDLKK